MVATRARWRVDWLVSDDSEGAGDDNVTEVGIDGETGVEKAVDEGDDEIVGAVVGGGETEIMGEADVDSVCDDNGRPVGRPWAARALTTASQPFSKVLIRSLSSSFSRSLASSDEVFIETEGERVGAGDDAEDIPMPARSWRFSSSSSATLRSR